MIKINAKRIPLYFFVFIVVIIISTFGRKITDRFDGYKRDDEYELIRKYLLNDSSFGNNKPKLWIHSKYMNKSKVCKVNDTPCDTELEHPYISIAVETIVNQCHHDFNICLIDDESFSKLIPEWTTDINSLSDPHKSNYRELGMTKLLYIYGGIIVPNSFVCLKSFKELYDRSISLSKPFVGEFVNNKSMDLKNNKRLAFIPDTILIGSKKEDIVIKQLVEYHTKCVNNPHFSEEPNFKGKCNEWCLNMCDLNRMTLIDGQYIGTKSNKNKSIKLEDLMDNVFLSLHTNCIGIYISHEELLKRIKYQWFSLASYNDVMDSKTTISKYIKRSIENTNKPLKSKSSI